MKREETRFSVRHLRICASVLPDARNRTSGSVSASHSTWSSDAGMPSLSVGLVLVIDVVMVTSR